MLRLVLAALAVSLLVPSTAAGARERRPPDGGLAAYRTPSQSHGTVRTVVHWVTTGTPAPPLNDDDRDLVPDYVEAVADAAEISLSRFAERGFRAPPADSGGPDGRIDLYVAELPFGILGAMLPPDVTFDGSFLIVSPTLDRREPVAIGSLKATVAHEIFHLVQHAYRFHHLPDWLMEGTADTMASLAVPEATDWLNRFGVERWVRSSATTAADNDPYGSADWWSYLERRDPGFVRALLEQRERDGLAGADADPEAYALVDRVHRKRHGTSIDRRFQEFAADLALRKRLALGTLATGERRLAQLGPLAIRAYRPKLPGGTRALTLESKGASAPAMQVLLRSGRRVVTTGKRLRVAGDLTGATIILTGRSDAPQRAPGYVEQLRLRLSLER